MSSLQQKISQLYSYIIEKGFVIKLNGSTVRPQPLTLQLDDGLEKGGGRAIAPYVYVGEHDGVEVTIAAGFYRPLPSEEELEEEREGKRYSSESAGWTVILQ